MTASTDRRLRVLSGIQPTADSFHLGNYLGALRQWVRMQDDHDAYYFIPDLHAITVEHDPALLAPRTRIAVAQLLALGLDPARCTVFVQSQVPEHAQLAWVLGCITGFGEAGRMTQFKDKSSRYGQDQTSVGLFTYPVLMAADILLYDADRVPVGEDQRQHLELCRDVALRFNHRYGETFVVPEAVLPKVGARVMDLQRPTAKMSKSADSPQGTVLVLDDPKAIERKIKRAVTDTGSEVVFDPDKKPGVANLLQVLGAATGRPPAEVAEGYSQYGPLKADTAEAVVELLRPVRARYAELAADPQAVQATLEAGAEKAQGVARGTLARARDAIGLLARAAP
jgi:tryptophanyl-tRNA synthetase